MIQSIAVGLQEQGDIGLFVGCTVDDGSIQALDWIDNPEFLASEKVSSVVLSTGQLLAIGTDPRDGDLRGELLPLE